MRPCSSRHPIKLAFTNGCLNALVPLWLVTNVNATTGSGGSHAELVQACGCTQFEAHQLVNYVFSRPVGDTPQEVGGVMLTLASLCHTQGIDMIECGETELARVWTKVEQI